MMLVPIIFNNVIKIGVTHPHNFKMKKLLALSIKIMRFEQNSAVIISRSWDVKKFAIRKKKNPVRGRVDLIYTCSDNMPTTSTICPFAQVNRGPTKPKSTNPQEFKILLKKIEFIL